MHMSQFVRRGSGSLCLWSQIMRRDCPLNCESTLIRTLQPSI